MLRAKGCQTKSDTIVSGNNCSGDTYLCILEFVGLLLMPPKQFVSELEDIYQKEEGIAALRSCALRVRL